MIKRMPTHCGDDTCSSCVVAGDFIFLAHHAGDYKTKDIEEQTRAAFDKMKQTLSTVGASLDDVVQINYYIRNIEDFRKGAHIFKEYFKDNAPARMTITSDFVDEECVCQIDGIAYKKSI